MKPLCRFTDLALMSCKLGHRLRSQIIVFKVPVETVKANLGIYGRIIDTHYRSGALGYVVGLAEMCFEFLTHT